VDFKRTTKVGKIIKIGYKVGKIRENNAIKSTARFVWMLETQGK
jgi:hypothetical protein